MKTKISQWAIAITAVIIMNGCIKTQEDTLLPPPSGYISIMHLAPTAPSVDVFFNDAKVSNNPFDPGATTTAYNPIERGAITIKFKKAASDSVVAQLPLAQYDSLNYYTVFIYNLQANGAANAYRIKDDFTVLTSDKAYYRFIHASPNAGDVDVYIDDVKVQNGRHIADNAGFDTYNRFMPTNPGNRTIEARMAGTNDVVATLTDASLVQGNAYTFYLKGLAGGSGNNELSIGMLRAQ